MYKYQQYFLIRVAKMARSKDEVLEDLDYWILRVPTPEGVCKEECLWYYFKTHPEFRTVYYYRTRHIGFRGRVLTKALQFFYRPIIHCYVETSLIGGGLFIQHGFSTKIVAKQIGKRCQINQQVTIGYGSIDPNSKPSIGNDVRIHAGAILFGDITVGDGAWIGAGAVVNRNVPAGATVVGNPARIVRLNGKRVDLPLGD